jgi:type III secretion protein L
MTGLVKASAREALVRPIMLGAAHAAPALSGEEQRLAAAADEIERLRHALEDTRAAADKAIAAAREEGRREGEAAAMRDDARRLALLEASLEQTGSAFEAQLAGLEGLAVMLAQSALARIFDPPAELSQFVALSIARRVAILRHEAVRAVRVSPADFADPAALSALAAEAGTGAIEVAADASLEAGECRLELILGYMDIGPRAQWRALNALLDGIADDAIEAETAA